MKKNLLIVAAAFILMCTANVCYADSSGTSGDWKYYEYGDGTASLRGYTGTDGAVMIPTELDGYEITTIGVLGENDSTVTVTIPDSITTVSFSAFKNFTALKTVNIGAGVTKIGGSYDYFPDDESYDDPSGTPAPGTDADVSAMAQNPYQPAFEGCISLEQFNVSADNTVFSSEDGVLFNKDKTMLLLFPQGRSGSYTVPDSVTSLDPRGRYYDKWSPFYDCAKLEELILSDNITGSVEDISGMDSLKRIYIGKGITESEKTWCSIINGLRDNLALEQIDISSEHETLASEDGVAFNKDKSELVLFPPAKGESYIVPDTVTEIRYGAFSKNHALNDITLPDSLETISTYAFYGCALSQIEIPQSVKSIYPYAFAASELENIKLPKQITDIKYGMFNGCKSLASIVIPKAITTVGTSAFENCTVLKTVYYTGTEDEWDDVTVESDNTCLTTANIVFNSDYDDISDDKPTMYYEIGDLFIESEFGEVLENVLTGNGFIAEVSVTETTERDGSDYLFVCVYGTDGELLSLDYVKANLGANSECSFGFYVPAQDESVGSITAYVWDGFTSMQPMAESKSLIFE